MEIDAEQRREEEQYRELERVLFCIEDVVRRADAGAETIRAAGGDPVLVELLTEAAEQIREVRRRTMSRAYFRAPKPGEDGYVEAGRRTQADPAPSAEGEAQGSLLGERSEAERRGRRAA